MDNIKLVIVSPDGTLYNDNAEFIKIRIIEGDIGIKGEHANYFSVISFAECMVKHGGKTRYAACSDGYISVKNKTEVKLVATTFEWAENIEASRAEHAYASAKNTLLNLDKSSKDYKRYKDKLKRAETRKNVVQAHFIGKEAVK